jgi:FkbM family methyltransferase
MKRALAVLPTPIRRWVKNAVLTASYNIGIISNGSHFLFDIKRRLPNSNINVIFDVGANRGQSIKEYRTQFPRAEIVAFEPDPLTFSFLRPAPRMVLNNIGLSHRAGRLRFDNRSPVSELHRIAVDQTDDTLPVVEITTLDDYCDDHGIRHINLLKIDTEGHDLNVLRGARRMLRNENIDIIICECSLSYENNTHIQFAEIQKELESLGYKFFGLYNQETPHMARNEPHVAWANCAYVSQSIRIKNVIRWNASLSQI